MRGTNLLLDMIAITVCFLFVLAGSLININRFWQYDLGYYDFGIFDHAIWEVAHFRAPIIDHFRVSGKWIWADHFNPSIFLFSPIYWFTDKSEVLLIVHNLMIGLSGLVIYQIGKSLLKNNFLSFSVLLTYFLYTGLQNASYHEFHEVTVMTFFLSLTYWAIFKGKKKLFFLFFLITLGFKETLILLGIGLSIFIYFYKKTWRRIAVSIFIFTIFYAFITLKFIIPYFLGDSYHYIKEIPSEFMPILIRLFNPIDKIKTLFWNLYSFLFLPLGQLSLWPILVLDFISRSLSGRFGLGLHYNAEIAPTLAIGSILTLASIKKRLSMRRVKMLAIFLIINSFIIFRFILHGPFLLAINPAFYRHTNDFEFLNKMIRMVPKNAKVVAQNNLASRFLHQDVWILRNNYSQYNPDYILLDFRPGQNVNNYLGIKEEDRKKLLNDILGNSDYAIVYHQGDQYVFKKKTID